MKGKYANLHSNNKFNIYTLSIQTYAKIVEFHVFEKLGKVDSISRQVNEIIKW